MMTTTHTAPSVHHIRRLAGLNHFFNFPKYLNFSFLFRLIFLLHSIEDPALALARKVCLKS